MSTPGHAFACRAIAPDPRTRLSDTERELSSSRRWTQGRVCAKAWNPMIPATHSLRSSDIAIDVGTFAVRVSAGNQLVRERKAASGNRNALAGGVIVDRATTTEVLRPILGQARRWMGFPRVRALACAPSDATAEEKAALAECITSAGASAVFISPEPLAAAIGSGIDVASPYANVLIDIGEGVTDCAVIRSAQIATSHAVRVGCADLRASIREHVLQRHELTISEQEAERIMRVVGVSEDNYEGLTASGLYDGEACTFAIDAEELHTALASAQTAILDCIETLLHELPAALSVEVIEDGIFLSGGGALLPGMRDRVARATQVDVRIVADPLRAVVSGARAMLPAASTLRLWRD